MSRKLSRSISLTISYFLVASSRVALLDCRKCSAPLDIHQPNPNQPDQFLGTCAECGTWYRIELADGNGRALVILLPESGEILPTGPPAAGEMP